jgi:hypothetical protein
MATTANATLAPRIMAKLIAPVFVTVKDNNSMTRHCASNQAKDDSWLTPSHFLRHVHDELAVILIRLAQYPPKLAEKSSILARTPPGILVRQPRFDQIRQLRRVLGKANEQDRKIILLMAQKMALRSMSGASRNYSTF